MANFSKSFNFRNGVQVDNDKFIVKPSGLVGIGSTLPSQSLDVIGNVETTGTVTSNNIFAGVGLTVGTGVKQINLDAATGIITAANFFGDGSTLTNVVAIATAGFEERSGTLSTTFSVGIGSLTNVANVGSASSFPNHTLDVFGNARVIGSSIFTGLSTFSSDLVTNQLSVSGISTLTKGIIISQNGATINQANITGVSTFGGVVDINAAVDIDGDTQVDDLNVSGVATFSSLIDGNAGANISGAETIISSATISDLTSGRVVLAGTSGAVEDSGNLTFSGSELKITGDIFVSGISTFSSAIDLNAGIDVDGQADLDEVVVAGVATFSNNIQVGSGGTVGLAKSISISDGAHINLGDQDDLVLRHTGSRSEILERGTGGLKIFTDDLEIANVSGAKTAITATTGGLVKLFNDGDQKLNTIGTGVSVSNTLRIGSLNGGTSGLSTFSGELIYGDEAGLSLFATRRSLNLVNKDSGNINYFLNPNNITDNGVDRTGDFIWHSGGSSQLMTLTGIGGSLGIGLTIPSAQLHVQGTTILAGNTTFTGGVNATSINSNLVGDVTGNLVGIMTGNLSGNINGITDTVGISTFDQLRVAGTIGIVSMSANDEQLFFVNPTGENDGSDGTSHNKVFINNEGRIGIGTSGFTGEESARIEVHGDIRVHAGSVMVGASTMPKSAIDFSDVVDVVSTQVTGLSWPVDRAKIAYMIPPKVTTAQRNLMYDGSGNGGVGGGATVTGALLYNTTLNRLELYDGNGWVGLATVA